MIKAIETRYKGYRFRSRLEARWAVFFDAMKVGWAYETEGFHLESGLYLPDFWISPIAYRTNVYPRGYPPVPGWWVEIKPTVLTDREEALCRELSAHTGHVVYALAGNIGPEEFATYKWHFSNGGCGGRRHKYSEDGFAAWYGDTFLFYLCSMAVPPFDTDVPFPGIEQIEPAFRAARSARFEHGEIGAAA